MINKTIFCSVSKVSSTHMVFISVKTRGQKSHPWAPLIAETNIISQLGRFDETNNTFNQVL
jgi:hypothetical protein